MDNPPPRTYTQTKPRLKRGPYKTSNPVFDDLGNRICRVCHTRLYRSADRPRRWPRFCSAKCREWESYQRYICSTWCQCGAIKEKFKYYCPDCRAKEVEKQPLKTLRKRLAQYGVTLEWATAVMDKQGWQCVCGVAIDWGTCHVDHDHACCSQHPSESSSTPICGKCVRGFLCSGCNVGLGCFNDDAERMRRLANYLDLWASQKA